MAIQDTDKFLVNRSNQSYQVEAQNLMATIADDDLMLVNRSGQSYKVTGAEVKEGLGGGGGYPTLGNINDCFRSHNYQGNGSTLTINLGMDLKGDGALIWIRKLTESGAGWMATTLKGDGYLSRLDQNNAAFSNYAGSVTFTNNGVTIGNVAGINNNGEQYALTVFKQHPGFFDQVAYTGVGGNQTIDHNLGAYPAMIWSRKADTPGNTEAMFTTMGCNPALVVNKSSSYPLNSMAWQRRPVTTTQIHLGSTADTNVSGQRGLLFIFGGSQETGTPYPVKTGSYRSIYGGSIPGIGDKKPQFLYTKIWSSGTGAGVAAGVRDKAHGLPGAPNPNGTQLLYRFQDNGAPVNEPESANEFYNDRIVFNSSNTEQVMSNATYVYYMISEP